MSMVCNKVTAYMCMMSYFVLLNGRMAPASESSCNRAGLSVDNALRYDLDRVIKLSEVRSLPYLGIVHMFLNAQM